MDRQITFMTTLMMLSALAAGLLATADLLGLLEIGQLALHLLGLSFCAGLMAMVHMLCRYGENR